MKTTPGPWTTKTETAFGGKSLVICDSLGRKIATPGWYSCDFDSDARLIAAAPDLLEALKKLEYFASYVAFKDNEADWGDVVSQAKKAIEKATKDTE